MTCSDNGSGLTADDFGKLMEYIGGSEKRSESDVTSRGRPKIGKIGIGLLAVAQICNRFRFFSSKEGVPRKFEAVVDLLDFTRPGAARQHLGTEDIGEYLLTDLAEERNKHYTTIVMEEIKPDFRRALQRSAAEMAGLVPHPPEISEARFREFVESMRDGEIIQTSAYHRLLWELSLVSPVAYFDRGPFEERGKFSAKAEELKSYDFGVVCDGFELRKPVLLPTDPECTERGNDFAVYALAHEVEIGGRKLKASGYLFGQRKAVRPSRLQGVLLRIRNVAIGNYDLSYLGFPGVPGPMAPLLSGEIYIEGDLEGAMNIDRASFRNTDALYLELQRYLFETLPPILQDMRRRSRERLQPMREAEAAMRAEKKLRKFSETLSTLAKRRINIKVVHESGDHPVTFNARTGAVRVWNEHPMFRGAAIRQLLLKQLLIGYEVANAIRPSDRQFLLAVLAKI